jgi:hypothetical protein
MHAFLHAYCFLPPTFQPHVEGIPIWDPPIWLTGIFPSNFCWGIFPSLLPTPKLGVVDLGSIFPTYLLTKKAQYFYHPDFMNNGLNPSTNFQP